jgi:TPR repeat protein
VYSQARLAWIYQHGIGRRQDFAESLKWDRIAAQHGYPMAVNNLAYLYEHGLGVQRDFPKAAKLYCEAAAAKLPEAQRNWSTIYSSIRGLPDDCAKAAQWLANAAKQELQNVGESVEAGPKPPVVGSLMSGALVCEKH